VDGLVERLVDGHRPRFRLGRLGITVSDRFRDEVLGDAEESRWFESLRTAEPRRGSQWAAFVDGLASALAVGMPLPRRTRTPATERIAGRLARAYQGLGAPEGGTGR
jgi:hypothetical protein